MQYHHPSASFSSAAFLASSSAASRSFSFSIISFSKVTLSQTVTSCLLSLQIQGRPVTMSLLKPSPNSSVTGLARRLMPVICWSIFLRSSILAIWFQRRLRQVRAGSVGKGLQMFLSLLFRTESLHRAGKASSPLMSVSQFSQTYNSFRFFMLAIPLRLRSLFFLSSKISMPSCPRHDTSVISFSDRLSLLRTGTPSLVSAFILLPERLSICRCQNPSFWKSSNDPIWFLEAFSHCRCSRTAIGVMSGMVLVLRSNCLTCGYFSNTGNSLYSSFSARVSLVQARERLLAVLLRPDRAPLRAYYNFFMSSSALSLAYSSAFFRSYYLSLSSSSCCLRSSSSCSADFSSAGGGFQAYYDMQLYIYR